MERSLYDRLGGIDAITAVARAFEERAAKDDRINQKFAKTNLDRLTKEFVDQLCQDTGGPCIYTGLSMKQTHTNMGVTSGEWDALHGRLRRDPGRLQRRESRTGRAPEQPQAHAGKHRRSRFAPGRNPAAFRVHTSTAAVSYGSPADPVDQCEVGHSAPNMASRRCCHIAV